MKENIQFRVPVEVTYANEAVFNVLSEPPKVKAGNTEPVISIKVDGKNIPLDEAEDSGDRK